jgi:hypothetical protein
MSVVLCGMAAKLTGNWLSEKETEADRWRELKKIEVGWWNGLGEN